MRAELVCVYLCTLAYGICHSAHLAVFPYVVASIGGQGTTQAQYGYLQSFFSVAQLIGGLVSGPWKDKYGAKALLLLSFGSIAAYNLLVAHATTFPALYLSRVMALGQHVMTATRALIADIADDDSQSVLLGRNMLAFSIGATIGPAVGGLLADHSLHMVSYAIAATALAATVLVLLWTRPSGEDTKKDRRRETSHSLSDGPDGPTDGRSSSAIQQISWRTVLADRKVSRLLLTKAVAETARSMVFSMLPAMVADECSRSTTRTGFILSYLGLTAGFVQGFLMAPLSARFRDDQILFGSMVGLACSYFVWCFNQSIVAFTILLVPLTMCNSLHQTVLTSMLIKNVRSDYSGTVIALDLSVGSAIGIFTPTLGGFLLCSGGIRAVCIVACVLYCSLVVTRPWKAACAASPKRD